jgi:hypothetical protein
MKHAKLLLALLLPTIYLHSTLIWEGATATQTQNDATIVSVVDQDLVINGDVQLPLGNITIAALTVDVNVTFVGGPNPADTTVRANDGATLSNLTFINFVVASGLTITFHINPSNVRFRGTNLEPGFPLMMLAEGTGGGSGEIRFVFENPGKTLQFTARPDSGGCQFYIERTAANGAPRVLFQTPHATNQVIVGPNGSLLGMEVGGLTNALYSGFVFDATGIPGNHSTLMIHSFGSLALETTV